MILQRLGAFPGFENDKSVRPELSLKWADVRSIDMVGVPLFRPYRGNVGMKGGSSSRRPGLAVMRRLRGSFVVLAWLVRLPDRRRN